MTSPVTTVLVGAGNRGAEAYGPYALQHPDDLRFVAVAEPNPERRARFAAEHQIAPERQYATWEALLASGVGKLADAALICTQDQLHVAPTLAAMELGYEVLLEKPMATSLADCLTLTRAAEAQGRLLQIGHVLRYTPFFTTLHEIVASGRLGQVITVEHRENVAYWHMAHSFVRGNWRNRAAASPMILAKCCHDLDILFWNLGPCARLSSFGSLIHYREENAPPGAPARCLDGCPVAETCPWYAPRLYLELTPMRHNTPDQAIPADYAGWPRSVISEDLSPAGLRRALETGPYGRCVYHCDNDVVDHQVVNMEMGMAGGPSVALTMHGHSHREGRTMRYDGTRATLRGCYYADEQRIEIHDHLTGEVEVLRPDLHPDSGSGHGGGDVGLMAAFVRAVRDPATALTTARSALESHLMAFAADEARRTGEVVDMAAFRAQL